MTSPQDQPADDPIDAALDGLVLDDDFVSGGPKEATADERIAKAARIARSNDRLRAAGEISDGSGKPRFARTRRSAPWIAIGAAVAIAIVVIVLVAR
ncbi:MAG: hypothetical protein Q8M17_17105 [Actinomycetota bacterium]|nr:hypothetical protein [Actinomycetota bacterium]